VLRECDEVHGKLCRDSERSRSSFTNKYLAVLRIDVLRQSFRLAIILIRLISDYGSECCVNRARVALSSRLSLSARRCPVICMSRRF
jgi:hypothetical protein